MADAPPWELHEGRWQDAPLPVCDVLIGDPPYSARTHRYARTTRRSSGLDASPIDFEPALDLRLQLERLAPFVRRWAVLTCDYLDAGEFAAHPPNGWRFVRFGVWIKPRSMPQLTGDRPAQGWEAVAILHRAGAGAPRLRWNGGGTRAIWQFSAVDAEYHPTQKPLPLLLDFVAKFSDAGETVLDPWCGSGTTGVAALRLGRRFAGCEMDERYFARARLRLEAEAAGMDAESHAAGQLGLFG